MLQTSYLSLDLFEGRQGVQKIMLAHMQNTHMNGQFRITWLNGNQIIGYGFNSTYTHSNLDLHLSWCKIFMYSQIQAFGTDYIYV